jgi:hypothetical protein
MELFGAVEPEPVSIHGRALRCQVCGNDAFWQRRGPVHAGVAAFFNLDATSPTCVCLVCGTCGYIHWFVSQD